MTICPISNEVMEEPIHINGKDYDRNNVLLYLENQRTDIPALNNITKTQAEDI